MKLGSDQLADNILAGDVRSASRLMRQVEDGDPISLSCLQKLFSHTGQAFILGITGPPGSGKSTLTDKLITHYRQRGNRVGVLAIDPSSPYTGGAILGDRIRMQAHANDGQVFIRSMATRGSLGGLSRATADCIQVMDAMGQHIVIVETVGVGQDEVDIAQLAHTTVVVTVPGMGDDIQSIKAGILEIADVLVVNKADYSGADRMVRDLKAMLDLRHAPAAWTPPILKTVAVKDEGLTELLHSVDQHQVHLKTSGELPIRNAARAATHFLALLRERLVKKALLKLEEEKGNLRDIATLISTGKADPYALVEQLAARFESKP